MRAHWERLFRTSYLLAGSRAEAEDLLQTALLRAFEHWDKVQAADSTIAYVRRILVNELASWRRTAGRRSSLKQRLNGGQFAVGPPTSRADPSTQPRAALGSAEKPLRRAA